jgi:hypothetical protein
MIGSIANCSDPDGTAVHRHSRDHVDVSIVPTNPFPFWEARMAQMLAPVSIDDSR